ncbi:MAG: polysaccharide pyruvyl transferase family protein [Verrucomicrobiota bacterium JB025]|nr:polysaccharide pyruvyl transferase family protein [Verrucomicrobiota bacterium JB025]
MPEFKTVGILNAYDARNRGDRAIVEAQMGWIRQTMPGVEILVFSPQHECNREVFGEASREPLISVPGHGNPVARLLAPITDWRGFAAARRSDPRQQAFDSCDAYFMCGGGYLYSSPAPVISRQLWTHAANGLAAIRSGKPVLAFPQSWGPVRKATDRWICHKLADALPVIVTRGNQSNQLLDSWGYGDKILSLPDIVTAASVLIPDVDSWRKTARQTGSLGIAPIDWSFDRKLAQDELDRYLGKLASTAAKWCETSGNHITLFPQVEVEGSDDDRLIARKLHALFETRQIPVSVAEGLDWNDYWRKLASQEAFIGCRMHACIFAMICGVPTVGLAYQPKFAELFEHLGWPARNHPIDGFDPDLVAKQITAISNDACRAEVIDSIDRAGETVVNSLNSIWNKSLTQA